MCQRQLVTAVVVFVFLLTNAWAGSWRDSQIADMNVLVYVPDTAPKLAGKRALMVNLHGCGQKNRTLQERGNWTETADEHGMVVALPNVPDDGVILGCWDYYGEGTGIPFVLPPRPPHSRDNRHNCALLSLVRTLLADESLSIDRNQIYLSGLSSGGGQTMVLGCLAPDVFAGIGINAGPTVGTGPNDTRFMATDIDRAKARCLRLAGDRRTDFATQLTSVVYGAEDTLCFTGYNQLNAEVMADLYGASETSSFSVSELPGYQPRGKGLLWSDADGPRVSLISVTGMDHAWPAGSGPGPVVDYVASEGVNYPAYVTAFFFENNRRVNDSPSIDADLVVVDGVATVSGSVTDSGPVDLAITITGVVAPFSEPREHVQLSANGQFSEDFGPLPDDNVYRTTLVAKDGQGALATLKLPDFDVGNPNHPPVVEEVTALVDRDCVHLRGRVYDRDGDLAKVFVRLDDAALQEAVVQDYAWTMEDVCGLDVGTHTAVVTAVDTGDLKSEPVTKRFKVVPPYHEITDTLTGHTTAQRFRYYPGKGFGAADTTYLELFKKHGVQQAFPLYGFDGSWYADPSQLQADIFSNLRLRAHVIRLLNGRPANTGAELSRVPNASTASDTLNRLPLIELIKRADQRGISLFDLNTRPNE